HEHAGGGGCPRGRDTRELLRTLPGEGELHQAHRPGPRSDPAGLSTSRPSVAGRAGRGQRPARAAAVLTAAGARERPVRLEDLDYELPPELIAQHPAPRREQARMLVVERATGRL